MILEGDKVLAWTGIVAVMAVRNDWILNVL